MTFDQKIELIKFADCNVSDVKKILDILSDNNIEIDNKLSGTDFLQSLSDNLLKCYDNERDQDKKLYDFFYYNKIETYSKFRLENEEEDDDEEDNDEDDDDFYLGYKEDKEKQKTFIARVTDKNTKEITLEILSFFKKENPNLLYTGFDRKVISELVDNFKEVNHITRLHFLPSKIYTKTYKAIDNSKEEIRKEISTFQKLNIKKYAEDFKKWMFENNISKKTKQNFKNFTKEKAIKIDEILITKVIDYNTDEII